jgi:hypothetical protein
MIVTRPQVRAGMTVVCKSAPRGIVVESYPYMAEYFPSFSLIIVALCEATLSV